MFKVTLLYGHPTDSEAFEQYYTETHLPLASKMKGVDKLELTRFLPSADGNKPEYYRMAELFFADEQQFQSTLNSAEGQAAITDLQNFADGGVTMLSGIVEDS